jgi:hypothetical protein
MITVSNILGDNRILIGNDYCGRSSDVLLDHSWTHVRIAMRLCLDDSGADINPAYFYVGLSTGPPLLQSPPGPPNNAHAAMILLAGNSLTWFRQLGLLGLPPDYFRQQTQGEVWVNGTRKAISTLIPAPATHYLGTTDDHRTLLFIDFTKGSPNWTVDYWMNELPACDDRSQADFEAYSLILSPSIVNYNWYGAMAMPVDEAADGYFTHVNIAWNNTAPVIKVSDLRVIKF